MGDRLVRKSLVVGIIFLFIGVGVYPAIAVKLNTSINTVQDEKSNVDAKIIEQLPDLPCDCEKNITTSWHPPVICTSLFMLYMWAVRWHIRWLEDLAASLFEKICGGTTSI